MQDTKTQCSGATTIDDGMPASTARPEIRSIASGAASTSVLPKGHGFSFALSRVVFAEPGDGLTWAAGNRYKASFGRDGWSYIPVVGSQASHNYPVSFHAISMRSGDRSLALDDSAAPQRDGNTIWYDRGSLVERYRLTLDSIEQEFTLPTLPSAGDLSVRVSASTELSMRETGEALEFQNDLVRVRYEQAAAIDALGRRVELPVHLVESEIEIVVPSAFIESAAFPITIDPLITDFVVNNSSLDDFDPDIAYDEFNNLYAVCWERVSSATDHDVYLNFYDATGAEILGSTTGIDITAAYWAHPRIANNHLARQFLVVAAVGLPTGGARQIWGCERAASSFTLSPQFQISDPLITSDQFDPDVGGDPATTGPTYYCVTWERAFSSGDHDIFARLVLSNATLLGTSTILIANTAGTLDEHPIVSKSDGNPPFATQDWTIVWQRLFSPTNHDIYGAQLRWDGFMTNPAFQINVSGTDDTHPTVSSILDDPTGTATARNYLVAHERLETGFTDIVMTLCNSNIPFDDVDLELLEGPNAGSSPQHTLPSVDSDGCQFIVAYQESVGTSTTLFNIIESCVTGFATAPGHLVCTEAHTVLYPSFDQYGVQITSQRSSGAAVGTQRCAAAWTLSLATNHDPFGALFDTAPHQVAECFPGHLGVTSCPCANPPGSLGKGCNNSALTGGALLTVAGNTTLSADTLTFTQTGELPHAVSIFLQGNADNPAGSAFGNGILCVSGTLKRLYVHSAAGGVVMAPTSNDLPVHTQSSNKGDTIPPCTTRVYQVYYRDPAGGCQTFNVGNAMRVIWEP
jgi:hypothetical protein